MFNKVLSLIIYCIFFFFVSNIFGISTDSNSSQQLVSEYSGQTYQLSIDQCLEISLKQNNDIIQAREDKNIAQAKTNSAWSTVLPKISFSSGFNRANNRMQTLLFDSDDSVPTAFADLGSIFDKEYQDIYSMSLNFDQLIFGMHALPTLAVSGYALDLAQYSYLSKKNTVIFKTKEAYFNILKSDELLISAEENKKVIEQLIFKTDEMVNIGLATNTDLLRLKLQLKNIEQGVLIAKNATKITRANLNLILGYSIFNKIIIEPISKELNPIFKDLNILHLKEIAIKNRPELKVLLFQKALYSAQIAVIQSQVQPSVFFNGKLGMANTKANLDYNRDKDWSVAVIGRWKLFDGGEIGAQIAEAEATVRKVVEQLKTLNNYIELELSLIADELNLSIAKIETAQAEVSLAEENYKLIQEKYLSDAATNLELIDSQTSLIKAKANLIQAQYDFEIAKAKLEKALGCGNNLVNTLKLGDQNENFN
jgi:outer membrane protein